MKEIGQAVGKVLRINTHTATEARGRYARICVQIDVDKPLINTILIGKLEQSVSYEGIQNLCFACGRIVHRRDHCQYVIRGPKSPGRVAPEFVREPASTAQERHDHSTSASSENTTEDVQDRNYEPWLVVSRKKGGRKSPKIQNESLDKMGPLYPNRSRNFAEKGNGPVKESKRKLDLDGNAFGSSGSNQPASAIGPRFSNQLTNTGNYHSGREPNGFSKGANQTILGAVWIRVSCCVLRFFFFFFLLQPHLLTKSAVNSVSVHCLRIPQITLFSQFFH